MSSVFLICLAVGAAVLVFQIVLSMVGFDADAPELDMPDAEVGGGGASAGLDLLSVRSVAAALAVFGVTGWILDRFLFAWLAAILAVPPAFGAAVLVAYLTRMILRLESDGSIDLSNAVGQTGTVYLAIPARAVGAGEALTAGEAFAAAGLLPGDAPVRGVDAQDPHGLVHVSVQGRTIEVRAVTREPHGLPTGSSVLVVAAEGDTVEVVPTPTIEGVR